MNSLRHIIISAGFILSLASCQDRSIEWISSTFEQPWQTVDHESISTETGENTIVIDTDATSGIIEGFGSCFNELGWQSLSTLTQEERDEIFQELYTAEGAKVLKHSGSYEDALAFINSDGSMIIVAANQTEAEKTISILHEGDTWTLSLPANSINTISI